MRLENIPTAIVPVPAVALIDAGGRVLLQQRRPGAQHAGAWEFPGGKAEPGESLETALLREIAEELGIELDRAALDPLCFAADREENADRRNPHVVLLYSCTRWDGDPLPLDAAAVDWFEPAAILALELAPLDQPLARALLATRAQRR